MPRSIPAVIFVALLMVALALALWKLAFVLLLAFFGLLLAVLLRHLALALQSHSPLSAGAALGVVVLALLAAIGLGFYFLGAQLAEQLGQLAGSLPGALTKLRDALEGQPLVQRLREMMLFLVRDCCGGRADLCQPLIADLLPCCPQEKAVP